MQFLSEIELKKIVPFLLFAGVFIIGASVAGMFLNPAKPLIKNPGNIVAPIVGLELVESPQEIYNIIGDGNSKDGQGIRDAFRKGFLADYVLITGFVLFNIFLGILLFVNKNISKLLLLLLCLASLAAGAFDILEDLTMATILDSKAREWGPLIPTLQTYTYFKWQLLGFACLIIGMGLKAGGKRFVPALFWGAFLLAAIGLTRREAIEWQGMVMGLAWLVAFMKSLPIKNNWWAKTEE